MAPQPCGPRPSHCCGFEITPRHTTLAGIRTRNPSKRTAADPRLTPHGHWDRHIFINTRPKFQFTMFCCVKNCVNCGKLRQAVLCAVLGRRHRAGTGSRLWTCSAAYMQGRLVESVSVWACWKKKAGSRESEIDRSINFFPRLHLLGLNMVHCWKCILTVSPRCRNHCSAWQCTDADCINTYTTL
jgi:hypothetical protein